MCVGYNIPRFRLLYELECNETAGVKSDCCGAYKQQITPTVQIVIKDNSYIFRYDIWPDTKGINTYIACNI